MYGTTTDTNKLYSIDYRTGKATEIGKLNAPLIHGLAYDESTDMLFGTYGEPSNNHLYQIDVTTGNATIIGDIGINQLISGLAIHPETHELYGVMGGRGISPTSYLTKIDKNTGAGTLLYEYHSCRLTGLTFSPDGTLYAIDNSMGNLYTLNISSGASNFIGNTDLGNPLGLASIPEPATLIMFGLGSFGLFSLKRRKQS